MEHSLVSFPGTDQEYSRRHCNRNCVQSDRAVEMDRDPDVAMLIKERANHMPRYIKAFLSMYSS
jgi:hypothetical protein